MAQWRYSLVSDRNKASKPRLKTASFMGHHRFLNTKDIKQKKLFNHLHLFTGSVAILRRRC
jgi:hypothetical protein